ncbi:MAG: alpha-L-rhamnosidase N-terminal domain-containing protein, partial [Candidatus Hinthialibacter sp.]
MKNNKWDRQNRVQPLNRRRFLQYSTAAGALTFASQQEASAASPNAPTNMPPARLMQMQKESGVLDLSPAKWIWYPSQRCLPNTFILFRKEINFPFVPRIAVGWILADSRYELFVNGTRIGFGPAPCDPRWLEADPIDITAALRPGKNVIAAKALFYGQGDGTSPLGKPGFIFSLRINTEEEGTQIIVSDSTWLAHLARSWRPGHYKRWYLRALQEEFDARLYPYGWDQPDFSPNEDWLPAMEMDCPADRPAICSTYPEYMLEMQGDRNECRLRPRSIPRMREYDIQAAKLTESYWINWKRPPEEYFECMPPDSFAVDRTPCAEAVQKGEWRVLLDGRRGAALTFELAEQVVGWPYFTIDAPEGAIVEMLVHEAHEPGGPALLNSHFHSWTRFICQQGENHFAPFDFESLRWIQLHIHGASGEVRIRQVGVRRRIYPWRNEPRIQCSDASLQRLFDASVNTLNNCAQETLVDGMARERQQYSGDCGHQLHALYFTFGETRQPARYLKTFSQGMTKDGYFLDCWPAYDRLARLMERQLNLTKWGPILDHGVGFNFDCYYHYLYTGDLTALEEPFPRLLRFAEYLQSILTNESLLPVENIGIPSVWIDHSAYRLQRHKQCAFNLYAAAMFEYALAPICRAFHEEKLPQRFINLGKTIAAAVNRTFWDDSRGLYINNLPWIQEEKSMRLCDRSLATAVCFDQCPGGDAKNAVRALAECPPEMGLSYPANAGWRLWALAKAGRADVIVNDLRSRWATMDSVILNNTLQENWTVAKDSGSQWSHCPVAPLFVLYMNLAGIRPLEPGFTRCEIRPQLAGLGDLTLTARTVQ